MAFTRADAAAEKSRVRWHCRRGMKELDVLLERFVSMDYDGLTVAEHRIFRDLLDKNDPDLYAVIIGQASPDSAAAARLVERIRAHRKPAGTTA